MIVFISWIVFSLCGVYLAVYLGAFCLEIWLDRPSSFPYWKTWTTAAACGSGCGATTGGICILGLTRPDGWIAFAICAAVSLGMHVAVPTGLMLLEECFDFSFM